MASVTIKTKFEPGEYGWICQENQLMRVKIDHFHISFCNIGENARDNHGASRAAKVSIMDYLTGRVPNPPNQEEEPKPEIEYVVLFELPGHQMDGQMGKVLEKDLFRNPEALLKFIHRNCETTYNINVSYAPSNGSKPSEDGDDSSTI